MRSGLLGAALAVILASASASAAIVTVTGTGTVTGGTDQTGVFGSVGDLTGSSFGLSFSYDTVAAPAGMSGLFFGPPSGWLSVTVSVNGNSFLFTDDPAATVSSVELGEGGASDLFSAIVQSDGLVGQFPTTAQVAQTFALSAFGDLFNSAFTLPLLTGALAATGSGALSIDDTICVGAICDGRRLADLSFEIASFSATSQSTSTPEPGALGILGIGLMGIGLSRRRKAA